MNLNETLPEHELHVINCLEIHTLANAGSRAMTHQGLVLNLLANIRTTSSWFSVAETI